MKLNTAVIHLPMQKARMEADCQSYQVVLGFSFYIRPQNCPWFIVRLRLTMGVAIVEGKTMHFVVNSEKIWQQNILGNGVSHFNCTGTNFIFLCCHCQRWLLLCLTVQTVGPWASNRHSDELHIFIVSNENKKSLSIKYCKNFWDNMTTLFRERKTNIDLLSSVFSTSFLEKG